MVCNGLLGTRANTLLALSEHPLLDDHFVLDKAGPSRATRIILNRTLLGAPHLLTWWQILVSNRKIGSHLVHIALMGVISLIFALNCVHFGIVVIFSLIVYQVLVCINILI